MSETLVENIEFRAVAPKTALPGLDNAHAKLVALSSALDHMNRQLAGLSTHSAFGRTAAGIADVIKQMEKMTGKGAPMKDVSKTLGFDPKDVREYHLREQEKLTQGIAASERKRTQLRGAANAGQRAELVANERRMQADLTSLRRTFEGQQQRVSGAGSASKFFYGYQKAAVKGAKEPLDMLQSLFAPSGGARGGGTAAPGGTIPLVVPANQIVATLGPGAISLMVPASQVTGGSAGAPPAGGGSRSNAPRSGGGGGGAAPSGNVIEERVTTTAAGKRTVQRKELVQAGETIDRFYQDIGGVLQPLKDVQGKNFAKAAKRKLDAQLAAARAELKELEAVPANRRDPATLAKIYRKQAAFIDSLVTGKSGAQLKQMGLLPEAERAAGVSASMRARATGLDNRAADQRQAQMRSDMKRTGTLRQKLDQARQRSDQQEEKRIADELADYERRIKANNQVLAARNEAQSQAATQANKVAAFNQKQQDAAAYKSATYAGAQAAWTDFMGRGGVEVSNKRKGTGPNATQTLVGEMESGGMKESLTVTYGKAGAEVTRLTKVMSESRKEAGYLGADFLKNTGKVAIWAASVGVLYKSLALGEDAMHRIIEIGPQMGRLEQVFKGVGGSAQDLTKDILALAAANGMDTREAMEAAIQWSRLGLTRAQVNEAVRLSMMAANVAQIDALEATEKLQSVMQAYGLTLGQLGGVLGQIVYLTNSYNVTTEDMLTGLTRVAAVAKQAKLPLAELQGLLAATIGGTGQSGANIGNMLKSTLLALSNPELQQKLRTGFRFESTGGGEEIKDMSRLLSDFYVKYQHLNDLQRQSLLFTVGGRTQSSRLEAMLDGYIKAQILAVNAQLHLNTAEQENEKIVVALRTQVRGLNAEWERFVVTQSSHGPVQAITAITQAMRNLLSLMNTPVGGMAATGLLGLVAAGSAKSIMAGMGMTGGGFLARTGAHGRRLLGEFNNSTMALYAGAMGGGVATDTKTRQTGIFGATNPNGMAGRLFQVSEAMLRVGQSTNVSSAAVRGMFTVFGSLTRVLGAGLIALQSWLIPLGVMAGGVFLFNRAMEGLGLSSERAEKRLAGFNEEAERAAAAANAYAEASEALNTIQRSLQPEAGFPAIREGDAKKIIGQSSELVGLYEPDLAKQEALQKIFKAQRDELYRQKDIAGIINLIEGERNKYGEARQRELQKQFVALETQRLTVQDEINRLKKTQGGMFGAIGHDSRATSIQEKEGQLAGLGDARVKIIMEETQAYEERIAYTEKYQSALKGEQLLWQSIAEVYQSVNANNPLERSALNIAGLEAQNAAIAKHRSLLDQQDQADTEGAAAKENALNNLAEREKKLRTELAAYDYAATDFNDSRLKPPGADEVFAGHAPAWVEANAQTEANRRRAELKGLELERSQTEAGMFEGGTGSDRFSMRSKLRSEDEQQRMKNAAEIDAQRRNQAIIEAQAQMQFGREEARRETSPFGVGRDETQRLQNTRRGIQQRLSELGNGPQNAETMSRQLELENQLYETQIALRKRGFDVEKDINQLIIDRRKEFEHSILGAGPGEMLRKLAALRMGQGGKMGVGQFLGLSPEMRRDVSQVDTRFDPQMMDLLRERNRGAQDSGFTQHKQQAYQDALNHMQAEQARFQRNGYAQSHPDFVRGELEKNRAAVTAAWKEYQSARSGQTKETPGEFNTGQLDISKQIAAIGQMLHAALPDTTTYEAAKANVDRLGSSAFTAAGQIDALTAAVGTLTDRINGGSSGSPTGPGAAPRNPQAGGVGAGAGHV